MTNAHPILDRFAKDRLIGIVRTDSSESAIWTATQLIETGIHIIEIPFTVPNAIEVMETLVERFPHAVIGAGTVLDASEAVKALGAGAQFLVSPVLIPAMVQFGQEHNVCVMPGCMTPTEMFDAYNLGAQAIKFFPAQPAGGPEFIKAVKAPLPQIPIVPTGGISKEHVAAYIHAGALAVGVGSPLIPKHLIQTKNVDGLKAHAQGFLHALIH
jgi:2-dehydro-3-deoxyphosphogluconate aldolase/(4S)-4-hydroxy-2-oxoglutarate aldolase